MQEGQFYIDKRTGEVGQLEAPTLYDPGDLPPDECDITGILWMPHSGDATEWVYVRAEHLSPLEPAALVAALRSVAANCGVWQSGESEMSAGDFLALIEAEVEAALGEPASE